MTSFIFWMIFIQVSIFFIVLGLVFAWFFNSIFRMQPAMSRIAGRKRFRARRPAPIQN